MVFSLIAKLIQIVGKFFKKEEKILKTSVEDIPMLIEKDFLLKKEELEEFGAKKISEVKYLHSRSNEILKDLSQKELESKTNERFNKAALTSKKQLENQLKKLLEKIDPSVAGKNLEQMRHYSGESYSLLVEEINFFRKNIVYTSVYLKDEMKDLGEALQEMLNIFNEMNQTFQKSKELFEFEKVKETVGLIIKKKKEIIASEKKLNELIEEINLKNKKITEQESKVSEKRSGKEMGAVAELEAQMNLLMNEKQDLKTEISALLINVDRPMQRFKQLVDSKRWRVSEEEREMLDEFLINPILALKKDPKAEVFKRVLVQISKAIEEGAVELKDKEKEKRLSALQEIINFDFFGKVFWKMNEIQKKQNDLNKELEKSAAKESLSKEETKLKEMRVELSELNERAENLKRSKSFLVKDIEKEIVLVKEFASTCLKKTIIFEEEAY